MQSSAAWSAFLRPAVGLPTELKASQPQIPWRKVADIGNVLRHEYDDVADTEVWRIVVDDLRALRDAVQAMISAL